MQTIRPLAACVQGHHSESSGEGTIYSAHYLLHSLSQAGPQQLLCFLFQLLLKFLILMNWKIFLSRLFAACFVSFFLPSLVTCYCTKFRLVLQNCFSKTRGTGTYFTFWWHVAKGPGLQWVTARRTNGHRCWTPIRTESSSQQVICDSPVAGTGRHRAHLYINRNQELLCGRSQSEGESQLRSPHTPPAFSGPPPGYCRYKANHPWLI